MCAPRQRPEGTPAHRWFLVQWTMDHCQCAKQKNNSTLRMFSHWFKRVECKRYQVPPHLSQVRSHARRVYPTIRGRHATAWPGAGGPVLGSTVPSRHLANDTRTLPAILSHDGDECGSAPWVTVNEDRLVASVRYIVSHCVCLQFVSMTRVNHMFDVLY